MAKAEIIHAWHARLHSIISTLDHSSAATPGRILKADGNGLPIESANTDAELADAVAKRHTQNTDTNLGAVGVKNPPVDADKSLYRDSAAGDALVTSTWTQVKAFLKTYFDTVYGAIALAHNRLHSITSVLDHTSGATPGQILKANANGLPIDASNTDAQVSAAVALTHARPHTITNALDHASAATPGKMLKADANGLPVDASNTDVEVASAVSLKHTQGTDVALGAVGTKDPPIDADKALYRDSTASDALKTSTWTQVKAFLKTYFDTIYRLATADHSHQSTGAQAGKLDHGLALDGLADDDHTQYIKHSLATAISDFLVASGVGVFVKKTLAEVKTLLNWAADIATHAGLTTGVHGVGAGTVAKIGDIAATKIDDLTAGDDNTDLNVSTTKHGLTPKAVAPAAGLLNVLGIANTETAITNKPVFDNTNPAALGTAAPGTQVIAARRDHVHANPAIDTLAAATDITTLNASTSAHGLVVKATAPASGLLNVVGIANGETAYTDKAVFDATSPSTQALGDSAVVGTAMAAARRDHKHAMPSAATAAEINTGTNTAKPVTPDALAGSSIGSRIMYVKVIDSATALTTGDGKAYITIPVELTGMNLVNADAAVHTAATGATLIAIQIRNVTDSVDMLSTKITLDASEYNSYTAATPPVIDGTKDDVVTGDRIAVDIDAIGNTTPGNGLDVILTFQLP